jgi:hypothetical protein
MRIAHPAKLGVFEAFGRAFGGLAGVALFGALGLGGCAQVQQGVDMIQPPPTFRDVPPKPIDVRAADAYKTAVMGEIGMRRELAVWRAAHPELTSDTDAWADLQRHRIPRSLGTPVAETHDAEAEAFAKRLREEAEKTKPQ